MIPKQAKIINGGCILEFPIKGQPPAEFGDYKREEGYPFRLILRWLPCSLRTVALTCLPCDTKKMVPWCKTKQHQVDQIFCANCDIREEPKNG